MKQPLVRQEVPLRFTSRILAALVFVALTAHGALGDQAPDRADPLLSSSNYTLVGIAKFDGISYASLLDRQTGNHFLLSTDKKSELNVALSSVRTDYDPSGPAAIVEKDSVSVIVKLESGISLASSGLVSSPALFTQPSLAPNTPQSGSLDFSKLKPPPGTKLPLVFQEVDPNKMTLSDEQKATLKQLRQDFINTVNGVGVGNAIADVSASALASNLSANANIAVAASQNASTGDRQYQNWIAAQEHSDEMFRMLYGYQAFNAYTESSSYPTAP